MNTPTTFQSGTPLAAPAKYWAIFKTQLINSLAYPMDLASRSLTIVLFMWVFIHLWQATYSAVGATSIAGLTLRETLWYLMLAETIVLSKPRLSRQIADSVKDGGVAYLLNKPYNFLLYHLSIGLGDTVMNMVFNVLAGGAIVWWMVGPPPPVWGWPLVFVAMMGAWMIDFCIAALIGLAAFVTEEVAAFDWIYSKILFILGGLLIPLDFFPDWLRLIASALPFAVTLYGPSRLFVDPSLARFGILLATQAFWLLVLGGILWFVYQRGVSWLSINGG